MNNIIGVTDQPLGLEDDKDLLGISSYAKGLCDFINQCPTPMSIALQGDWGSGKTSVLNLLSKQFANRKEYTNIVDVITINTWSYSHISEQNLVSLFIASILDKISNEIGEKEKYREWFSNLVTALGKEIIDQTGIGTNFKDLFDKRINQIEQAESIRDKFEEIITKRIKSCNGRITNKDLKDKRIVILVDDLDRLNPAIAVELLEAMKLFLDVKNCVFVLAIDYDIVVQGVRLKYGNDVSDEKCKNFFDKIIQLPFLMPVKTYKMNSMIENYLGSYFDNSSNKEELINAVSEFTTYTIGTNPRSMKRIVNSFALIQLVQKAVKGKDMDLSSEDYAVLFSILCVQITNDIAYSFIIYKANNGDDNSLSMEYNSWYIEYINEETDSDFDYKASHELIIKFSNLLNTIYLNKEEMYNKLMELTILSSLTNTVDKNIENNEKFAILDDEFGRIEEKSMGSTFVEFVKTIINSEPNILQTKMKNFYTEGPATSSFFIGTSKPESDVSYEIIQENENNVGKDLYIYKNYGLKEVKKKISLIGEETNTNPTTNK